MLFKLSSSFSRGPPDFRIVVSEWCLFVSAVDARFHFQLEVSMLFGVAVQAGKIVYARRAQKTKLMGCMILGVIDCSYCM